MGQMKKFIYIGAYIELGNLADGDFEPYKKFQDYMNDNDRFDHLFEKFIFPYQGLEGYNILVPHSGDWGEHQDEDEEHIWNFGDFDEYKETELIISFKDEYTAIIGEITNVVGSENIHIRCGIIDYFDERA